jgi:hypothetical protein
LEDGIILHVGIFEVTTAHSPDPVLLSLVIGFLLMSFGNPQSAPCLLPSALRIDSDPLNDLFSKKAIGPEHEDEYQDNKRGDILKAR